MSEKYLNISGITAQEAQRFWAKTKKQNNGCWEWQGAISSTGYGNFRSQKKTLLSHRIAYFLYYQNEPADKCVCHLCDNPLCCNPLHLWLGTKSENNWDKVYKGRAGSAQGEKNFGAKLTANEVKEVRQLHESGLSQTEIGRRKGIGQAQVWRIINRLSWKHI